MKHLVKPFCLMLAISLGFLSCKKDEIQSDSIRSNQQKSVINSLSATEDDSNLLLGNPDGAQSNIITSASNYLMDKIYYALSYNAGKGTPNWVSWHLKKSDIGDAKRKDDFRSDLDLYKDWYSVKSSSYTKTGFDRGHNCNSEDRTSSPEANSSTFLMTNMMPQAPRNNEQTWKNLEDYTRSLVKDGSNEAYVICGSYGEGGTGSNDGVIKTIDNGHVVVPSNIWKIIVVLADGSKDLSRITSKTRVIAVNTPNRNDIDTDWKKYITSVSDIEKATKYNFFTSITDNDIKKALKEKIDKPN